MYGANYDKEFAFFEVLAKLIAENAGVKIGLVAKHRTQISAFRVDIVVYLSGQSESFEFPLAATWPPSYPGGCSL